MGRPHQNISCNVSYISQHHAIQRCILRCCKSQGHNPLVSIHQPVAWTTLVHFWTTIVQLLHGFVKVITFIFQSYSMYIVAIVSKASENKTNETEVVDWIDSNNASISCAFEIVFFSTSWWTTKLHLKSFGTIDNRGSWASLSRLHKREVQTLHCKVQILNWGLSSLIAVWVSETFSLFR